MGGTSSHSTDGSSHRSVTASTARLVLASATRPPNWIISGSLRYCGAPPDREITVAMETAANTVVGERGDEGRDRLPGSRHPGGGREAVEERDREHRDAREVREVERELDGRGAIVEQHRRGRSDHDREQVVTWAEQEQADDRRDLAQRERVRLASEVDLDDLDLGEVDAQRDQGPGDRQRCGDDRCRGGARRRARPRPSARRAPPSRPTREMPGRRTAPRPVGTPRIPARRRPRSHDGASRNQPWLSRGIDRRGRAKGVGTSFCDTTTDRSLTHQTAAPVGSTSPHPSIRVGCRVRGCASAWVGARMGGARRPRRRTCQEPHAHVHPLRSAPGPGRRTAAPGAPVRIGEPPIPMGTAGARRASPPSWCSSRTRSLRASAIWVRRCTSSRRLVVLVAVVRDVRIPGMAPRGDRGRVQPGGHRGQRWVHADDARGDGRARTRCGDRLLQQRDRCPQPRCPGSPISSRCRAGCRSRTCTASATC